MTRRPERPRLTAHREAIVPAAPGVSTTATAAAPPPALESSAPTTTVSLRVPVEMAERLRQEMRRLHYEHGATKGDIGVALLSEAFSHMDAVTKRLTNKP